MYIIKAITQITINAYGCWNWPLCIPCGLSVIQCCLGHVIRIVFIDTISVACSEPTEQLEVGVVASHCIASTFSEHYHSPRYRKYNIWNGSVLSFFHNSSIFVNVRKNRAVGKIRFVMHGYVICTKWGSKAAWIGIISLKIFGGKQRPLQCRKGYGSCWTDKLL